MAKYIFHIIFLAFATQGICQSAHKLLLQADSKYVDKDYHGAEILYRKAKDAENTYKSQHNLGNATFQQGLETPEKLDEAIGYYEVAASQAPDKMSGSNSYYNLGNAYLKKDESEKAIEAYKMAIRLNKGNEDARTNLMLAQMMEDMKKAQEPPEDQQQQQQNEEQQDQENQEEQEEQEQNEDQQPQDGEPEESEEQEQQEEKQDSTQQQEQEEQSASFDSTRLEKQTLDSLDAVKLLEIIQSEEQKVQEKLRKYNSKRKRPEKDW